MHFTKKSQSKRILSYISRVNSKRSMVEMFILNLIVSVSLMIYKGFWLVPDLDLVDFLVISVIVSVI